MSKYIKCFEEHKWDQFRDESHFEIDIPIDEWINIVLRELNIAHKNISPIGIGGNGSALDLGNDTVLKITLDKSEAFYANRLIDIDSPNLIKVFDVKRITSPYHYGELYAIHMEKLNTQVYSAIKHMVDYLHKQNPITGSMRTGLIPSDDKIYSFFKDLILTLDRDNILFIFEKWMNVYNECQKYDIPMDDFHSKNMGTSKRNSTELVFYDISSIHSIRDTPIDDIPIVNIPNN